MSEHAVQPSSGGEKPPSTWWLTPLRRTVVDFESIANAEHLKTELQGSEFMTGLANQLKELRRRVDVLYTLTFLGAIIVLRGGLGSGEIEAFGMKMPAQLASQQVISPVVSAMFHIT